MNYHEAYKFLNSYIVNRYYIYSFIHSAMKSLTKYLNEKLIINKDYNDPYTCAPTSCGELRKIIEDRYNSLGPGTKDKPIDFNDVDVRDIDSFYKKIIMNLGIFDSTKFEYIDISDWDVSNVECMNYMFYKCKQLKSVGDLSKWNVSKVKDMSYMFCGCNNLISVGDLSNWNVSNVEYMTGMFNNCHYLKSVGDLSKWNVSNVVDMFNMFDECKNLKSVGDLSNWDVSKVEYMNRMFNECEQLKSVGDLSKWNISKVISISAMFYNCKQLKSVGDLSNWNVSKVKYMNNTFKESGITNIPEWYKK